jgi:hypothetical protein
MNGQALMLRESRKVDNPLLTEGERRAQWEREIESALRQSRPASMDAVKIWAEENTLTRIGALAYIRPPRRQHHHEIAAETFKGLYEERYGSVGGAVDPSNEPVDTSAVAHDSGMAARIDRTVKIEMVETTLGKLVFNRLVAHIVMATPCAAYADILPSGQPNKRQVDKCVERLLQDLDDLAALWGVLPRAA